MKISKVVIGLLVGIFCFSYPAQARFLQTDPVGYQDDVDLYTYVGNDPTDKTDPSGKQPPLTVEGAEVLESGPQGTPEQLDAAGTALQAIGAVPELASPELELGGIALHGLADSARASAQIRLNAQQGRQRELRVREELRSENPGASVQDQQYLRDANGRIVKDPVTGIARRVDHAVIQEGRARTFETTGPNVNKDRQLGREERIRDSGGTFVRDRDTGHLCEVGGVSKVERCP